MKLFTLNNVNVLTSLFGSKKKTRQEIAASYKEELLGKNAREQFKKLMDKGLGVPVAYL